MRGLQRFGRVPGIRREMPDKRDWERKTGGAGGGGHGPEMGSGGGPGCCYQDRDFGCPRRPRGSPLKVLFILNGLERLNLDFRLAGTELCCDANEPVPPSAIVVNLLRKYLLPEVSGCWGIAD